jgi:hypothetical protein
MPVIAPSKIDIRDERSKRQGGGSQCRLGRLGCGAFNYLHAIVFQDIGEHLR